MAATNATLPFATLLSEFSRGNVSPSVTLLAAVVLLSGVLIGVSNVSYFSKPAAPQPILDDNGKPIPHFEEDTRFSRFSHGKEIGDRLTKELGDMWTWRAGESKELYVCCSVYYIAVVFNIVYATAFLRLQIKFVPSTVMH